MSPRSSNTGLWIIQEAIYQKGLYSANFGSSAERVLVKTDGFNSLPEKQKTHILGGELTDAIHSPRVT
jgi:hypothetical protein